MIFYMTGPKEVMMPSRSYSRFAGYAALGAGVCLIVYSYAFIFMFFLKQSPVLGGYLYSIAQTLGGLLTAIALGVGPSDRGLKIRKRIRPGLAVIHPGGGWISRSDI